MNWSFIWGVIALLIVLIVTLVIFIVIFRDRNEEELVLTCPSGTNPVNTFTGERFIDRQEYFPATENCQNIGLCTQAPNDFAVQPNGGSVPELCAETTNCDCVKTKNCPSNVTAFFVPIEINSQRFWLSRGVYIQESGDATSDQPLQTTTDQVCSLSASSLINVFNHSCSGNGRLTLLEDGSFACTDAAPCPIGLHPTFQGCQVVSNYPTYWKN
jgi:hypothetical protein